MANVYNASPNVWIVDTASSTAISNEVLGIDQIIWESGASGVGGDEAVVETNDATPKIIYDVFATGADFEEYGHKFPKNFHVQGLIVPTLAHGKLYIYLS